MHQITTETIPEEILNQYIPQEIKLREKLIRKINECYQWQPEAYNSASKGDYTFINKVLEAHIFHFC